jgi:hypothetical protein
VDNFTFTFTYLYTDASRLFWSPSAITNINNIHSYASQLHPSGSTRHEPTIYRLTPYKRRVIAQAVSFRLTTTAVRVRSQIRSRGIFYGQNALEQVYSEYFGFPRQLSFHLLPHTYHYPSSGTGTIGQIVADVPI